METEMIQVEVTAITHTVPVDQVCETFLKIEALSRRAAEIKAELKERIIEWIEENGEFSIGETRFYVGPEKSEKCRDIVMALRHLMGLAGDEQAFAALLSANAFKAGAVKKFLAEHEVADAFEQLFETTIKTDLKTGKAANALHQFNEAFVR